MDDLIYRAALRDALYDADAITFKGVAILNQFPVADAVEVETLKAWLYEMAMNNTSNYLGDACEEIISRLDGLRVFARERGTDATEAKPVVHGKWTEAVISYHDNHTDEYWDDFYYEHKECGYQGDFEFNFCPNCARSFGNRLRASVIVDDIKRRKKHEHGRNC